MVTYTLLVTLIMGDGEPTFSRQQMPSLYDCVLEATRLLISGEKIKSDYGHILSVACQVSVAPSKAE